jgi:hypothetical protein
VILSAVELACPKKHGHSPDRRNRKGEWVVHIRGFAHGFLGARYRWLRVSQEPQGRAARLGAFDEQLRGWKRLSRDGGETGFIRRASQWSNR